MAGPDELYFRLNVGRPGRLRALAIKRNRGLSPSFQLPLPCKSTGTGPLTVPQSEREHGW